MFASLISQPLFASFLFSPQREEVLGKLNTIFINMHHMINEFRPHQVKFKRGLFVCLFCLLFKLLVLLFKILFPFYFCCWVLRFFLVNCCCFSLHHSAHSHNRDTHISFDSNLISLYFPSLFILYTQGHETVRAMMELQLKQRGDMKANIKK